MIIFNYLEFIQDEWHLSCFKNKKKRKKIAHRVRLSVRTTTALSVGFCHSKPATSGFKSSIGANWLSCSSIIPEMKMMIKLNVFLKLIMLFLCIVVIKEIVRVHVLIFFLFGLKYQSIIQFNDWKLGIEFKLGYTL